MRVHRNDDLKNQRFEKKIKKEKIKIRKYNTLPLSMRVHRNDGQIEV